MKDKTTILTIITYGILLSSASILINDLREFNFQQFQEFLSWSKTADKNAPWFASQNAIEWSYYIISAGIFFWRAYLIYGFTYFISILNEIEIGHYFSDKNISYFKKIGNIFIVYTLNVLVLRFLLAMINGSDFNVFNQFRGEFTLLIPCGLAFYLLAEIFKRAKETEQENNLTI